MTVRRSSHPRNGAGTGSRPPTGWGLSSPWGAPTKLSGSEDPESIVETFTPFTKKEDNPCEDLSSSVSRKSG